MKKKFLSYLKSSKFELIKKINKLELEVETLKNDLNSNIFNEVIKNYDKILMYDKLKQEIKHLKQVNKRLKNK